MKYIGVEQTTDSRHPETVIVRLHSRKHAAEWTVGGGGFAWPGSASADVPAGQQNWHHRLRVVYEMPAGWRFPTKRQIEAKRGPRPWEDRRGNPDIIAGIVWDEKKSILTLRREGTNI